MNIKSQKDFVSGLLFMAVGVAFAWRAPAYSVGLASRMGPGYFPLVLGILLTVIGGAVTFKSLVVETVDGGKLGPIAWKPMLLILLANGVFGAMLFGMPRIHVPPMGLMAGIYALTYVASLASGEFAWKEVTVLATVLAVLSYVIFILMFQLPLPVWPAFIAA